LLYCRKTEEEISLLPNPSPTETTLSSRLSHILIIDDEPEIAESLADYLVKKQNFQVSLAVDGQAGIDFLQASVAGQEAEVDLVLLDMRMPHLSGLDVLNWIRSHPDLRYTRVVLLTAAAGSSEKVEALTAGADDYITKPYRPQELLARVNTILRTLYLEKQLQRQSQQLAALNLIGQKVAATLEFGEVLATAVAGMDDLLLNVELGAVLMLEKGKLRYRALQGADGPLPVKGLPVLAPKEGILGIAFSEQTAVFLNHIHNDDRFQPGLDAPPDFDVTSMIVAPLVVRGRPVGVISAYNKTPDVFNEVDLDLYASLASSISEAIENAWLFQRIRMRQQQLLENRNTLQALLDGIPNPIYTINDAWQLVAINTSKADELETIPDKLVNQVCYRAFFQREEPCEQCLAAHTLNRKEAQGWTVTWTAEDHLSREWDVNAYPIPSREASSARAVIVWQDRTEERRLESSLLQAGKLAAIGQLAAGVAHEINNPLTAVNANAEMLKMFMSPDDENYESVELIA
jgi:DNA-binding response OmpR family regulator